MLSFHLANCLIDPLRFRGGTDAEQGSQENAMIRHSHRTLLFAIFCAFTSSRLDGQPVHTSTASSLLSQARAAMRQNHLGVARDLYRRAVSDAHALPLSSSDTLNYATAVAATGDSAAAQQLLTEGLSREPHSSILNDAKGSLLAASGEITQALHYFQEAANDDPKNRRAIFHLGTAFLTLNRLDDAQPLLEKAVQLKPDDFEAQLQLGRLRSSQHNDASALTHLRRAVELRPSNTPPRALYALAVALQASGDAPAALPLFDIALQSPEVANSSSLINAALAHMQTGDAANAITLYQRVLTQGSDTATLREDLGAAYLQQANLDGAIKEFLAGLVLEPDNPHLHYDLGLAHKLKDDLDGAIPEFQRAADLDPELPDPPFTLGLIFMQQGRFTDAAPLLRRAVALNPNNGDAWALLGSVLKEGDDAAGATEAIKRAIQLEPDQPSLHIQLAALEQQAGDKEAAANDRKVAAELSRNAITAQRLRFALQSGKALLEQNKIAEAIVQFNNAVRADPKSSEPHRLLADAYSRQSKQAEAALERQRANALANASSNH